VKADGTNAFFLNDIVYHNIKFSRGYDKVFLVLDSNFYSYYEKMKLAIDYLGFNSDDYVILFQQSMSVEKDGVQLIAKNPSESHNANELISTISVDATR
jgi:arginyl-tRNA synthetase